MLSVLNAHNRILLNFQRVVLVLIYAFGFWIVSSQTVHSSLGKRNQIQLSQTTLRDLQSEISRIETARDHLLKTDRVGMVRKYDLTLFDLNRKLEDTRHLLFEKPSMNVIWNTLATFLAFRVLVVFSNLLGLLHLKRRLGRSIGV